MRQNRLIATGSTLLALLSLISLLSSCTLYSNTDRENFDARAVPQTPTNLVPNSTSAPSICVLKTQKLKPGDWLEIVCGNASSPQTIVRVSR